MFCLRSNLHVMVQVMPFKVWFSCRTKIFEKEACADDAHAAKATTSHSSDVDDIIWYIQFSGYDNSVFFTPFLLTMMINLFLVYSCH